MASDIEPRWYQQEAVNSVFNYYTQNNGNCAVALPTGTGKSIVIALLNTSILQGWPGQRILNLTHISELIKQNANKLQSVWPSAPMGIFSAGLNSRQTNLPIIFGGIQSVAKCPEAFGHRDIVFVDEAHLVNPKNDTQYQDTFARLKRINPYIKFVGLTATWFRLGQGLLTEGTSINGHYTPPLFTDICYNQCGMLEFNELIRQGYISPLIPKRTELTLDVQGVAKSSTGDYNETQLQEAVDCDELTYKALRETVETAGDRHCWMIFCAGKDHSRHVAEMLTNVFGIPSKEIHSGLSIAECDKRFAEFKRGEIRCITGMNKFTTGFDHPPVDLIVILRPTLSPVLWVQMLGRGTRPYAWSIPSIALEPFYYDKQNCLVLDFAANTKRLGPINDPIIPKSKKGGKSGNAPFRVCEHCNTYNHPRATHCIWCELEFIQKANIEETASSEELIRFEEAKTEFYDVKSVVYKKKASGKTGIPMFQAVYNCGYHVFSENILFEHTGLARHRAHEWWRQRHALEPPNTVDEALSVHRELRTPKRVHVWVNKTWPEILSYEF